jgi:hypothetical protein
MGKQIAEIPAQGISAWGDSRHQLRWCNGEPPLARAISRTLSSMLLLDNAFAMPTSGMKLALPPELVEHRQATVVTQITIS